MIEVSLVYILIFCFFVLFILVLCFTITHASSAFFLYWSTQYLAYHFCLIQVIQTSNSEYVGDNQVPNYFIYFEGKLTLINVPFLSSNMIHFKDCIPGLVSSDSPLAMFTHLQLRSHHASHW